MKPYRLSAPLALALATLALAGGASTARAADACNGQTTNVVLYSTDTTNLANKLGANPAACTDYWISITPTGSGLPRGGAPLAAIHNQGPHFHAMAELRQKAWKTYAATNGWYATGQMLHDALAAAGYDLSRDTWAENEVGWPSDDINPDVFNGVPGARTNFEDFIRGLHDGTAGPALAGLVFSAAPSQMSTDAVVAQYRDGLSSWYRDSQFWDVMHQNVRFWAEEAYADVRAWGTPAAAADQWSAYLNDYYRHGIRLAVQGGDATAAAQAFLADAYTPIGSAAYRWSIPDPNSGLGFGYTDIPIADMQTFISAQTNALRSSSNDRFGFALVPRNATGAENLTIEAGLAAAIAGPVCESGCGGSVPGAFFPETWRAFAAPPKITPHVVGAEGANGWYVGEVTVSWSVDAMESPITSSDGCETVTITADTAGTSLTCTAANRGGPSSASVTLARDATPPTVACTPTPATLWPPNGKLVPVSVDVSVTDETSGPAGFVLTGAPEIDAADFVVGTPDLAGMLRAQRAGDEGDRVYTLTYTAYDAAGNMATCDATVTAPHDQGNYRS
jgi:hypothetical protein